MPHFFISPENIRNNHFEITGSQVHHLIHVRRLSIGSELNLFDGTGKTYQGKIESVTKEKIAGVILEETKASIAKARIELFHSVPKGERFDWLIEKSAELGIAGVTPIICSRSIVKAVSDHKLARWRRLSESACQQCSRPDIMKVHEPKHFEGSISLINPEAVSLIAWESEDVGTVKETFRSKDKPSEANIFIGPEGGFDPKEIEMARLRGIVPITLGKRILRVETAGIVASILVLNEFGEFE